MRETREELGLRLDPAMLGWRQSYPRLHGQPGVTWLFVMRDDSLDPARIALGDEGQAWRLMRQQEFVSHPRAVPHLAERLGAQLAASTGTGEAGGG